MYVFLLKVIARDLSRNWLFVEIETQAKSKGFGFITYETDKATYACLEEPIKRVMVVMGCSSE